MDAPNPGRNLDIPMLLFLSGCLPIDVMLAKQGARGEIEVRIQALRDNQPKQLGGFLYFLLENKRLMSP